MMQKTNITTSSALNSSSKQETFTSYLPDECWESIFRFIIIDDKVDDCNNNSHYFRLLSSVSKHFLSITNRLRSSLTLHDESTCCHLFKRFTNLNYLDLTGNYTNLDNLLIEISRFPLKQLTSLNLSRQLTIPATGLRVFSQKITTLTSLTCSLIGSLSPSDLFLIAECFPLLQELDLSYPYDCRSWGSHVDGVEALSLALTKLRKVNLSGTFPINNQSLFHLFNNCKQLEEVKLFKSCYKITSVGLASALRERPTLRYLSFSGVEDDESFLTSQFIHSLVSLKSLTCLFLHNLNISDELLCSIARKGLPLTKVVLLRCTGHSCDGISDLLSKCRRIQHLDLRYNDFLKDQDVVELSLFLVDLVFINLSGCTKLTKSALFTLARHCPSLSEIKMENIGGKKVGNSFSLREFGVYPQLKSLYLGYNSWLNDKFITKFASIFPNLQLLNLKYCKSISEGICEVLRKCCKIRHLNLAHCSRVNLLGMNFVVPNLEVLNLSYINNVEDETLYLISKNCCGLLKLSLKFCDDVELKGVKNVVENCKQLRKIKGVKHMVENCKQLRKMKSDERLILLNKLTY